VAGWLLPPFAHQWQDRQKERDLKRELATQLDRDITTAVISAQLLLTRQFPEAQTAIVRKRERDDASSPGRREKLNAEYEAASEREREAGTRTFVRDASAWFVTRSVSISTLNAYFPEDDLPEKWREYTNRVTYYLHLGSSRVPQKVRRAHIDNLIRYLGVDDKERSEWLLLLHPSTEVPPTELDPYQEAAGRLAERLLKRKNAFVAEILAAHAAGFSTEPSDLVDELVPFLG
jgi:hypothetical protein